MDQSLGHERDADEPVGGTDELHHLDLTPAGEHRDADRLPLGFVGGAGEHLVERLGWRSHLETTQGATRGLRPAHDLGQTQHRIEAEVLRQVLQQLVGISVEEHRRLAQHREAVQAPRIVVDMAVGEDEIRPVIIVHIDPLFPEAEWLRRWLGQPDLVLHILE